MTYRLTQKSDPTQSVVEKLVKDRLKCFKLCYVTKRLPNIMSVCCNFFRHSIFPKLRILQQRACKKSHKRCQKRRIDLQPLQIFKTTRSVLYFKLGIGSSFERFQSNFIVLRYQKILVSRDTDTPTFLFDLRGKLNSFEIQ